MDDPRSEPLVRATVVVNGRVQGVGYRAYTLQAAVRRGLSGGVRNLDDGRVEIDVEGLRPAIEQMIRELNIGPPQAHVVRVDVQWHQATGAYHDFHIWY